MPTSLLSAVGRSRETILAACCPLFLCWLDALTDADVDDPLLGIAPSPLQSRYPLRQRCDHAVAPVCAVMQWFASACYAAYPVPLAVALGQYGASVCQCIAVGGDELRF
ncbi:Uncharacterised protein [Vibrio cholerae]|nr:Uncharacterised protein [Vibrio cholerae]